MFKRFLKNEGGATAIEVGLIAALIAVVLITAWNALGPTVIAMFHHNPPPASAPAKT